MAIVAPLAELIRLLHIGQPITGRVLTIGRQDFHLFHSDGRQWTDSEFFSSLGIDRFDVLDISDYEGANIVLDLSEELPAHLHGCFDFILNGSCLDNIFDPVAALRNISRMLAVNGRVLHMEHGTGFNRPYLMFPPGWLADYYEANRFADIRAWVGLFADARTLYRGPWRLFEYQHCGGWAFLPNLPPVNVGGQQGVPHLMSLVAATKTDDSSVHVKPVQWMYRPGNQGQAVPPDVWLDRGWIGGDGSPPG